jgi:hypothetical protein
VVVLIVIAWSSITLCKRIGILSLGIRQYDMIIEIIGARRR